MLAIKSIVEYTGMDQLQISNPKARRVGKYTIIRVVSRLGDYLITNTLILLYGAPWFYPAIILGAAFNCASDYFGQKLWVFRGKQPVRSSSPKEICVFLLLRGIYAVPAVLLLILLYKIFTVPFLLSSFLVMVAMWFVSFRDFEALFVKHTAGAKGWLNPKKYF